MKKINWGWRITILYCSFAALMLFMVWRTGFIKDDLVSKDYYADELKYQDRIDKKIRAQNLNDAIQWQVSNKEVLLQFPVTLKGKPISGEILFYRPADKQQDLSVPISADVNGVSRIHSDKFVRGVYQMQIDWKAAGIEYYTDGIINMN